MEFIDLTGHKTFRELIVSGDGYVDKTGAIAELYKNHSKFEMLVRPLGFGKTVLLDTIYYLFSKQHPEFFKDLLITKSDVEIPKETVIKIDFSKARTESPEKFKEFFSNLYRQIVFEYGLSGSINNGDTIYWQTVSLIKLLAKSSPTGKCIILIDDYDAPIIHEFFNNNVLTKVYHVLLDFFRALGNTAGLIDWCLITGETKFYLNSPNYEGLAYIMDLTFCERATAICGFTEGEMKHYYNDFIQDEAEIAGITETQFLSNLGDWYGGFRYTGHKILVMRPASIKSFLSLTNQNIYRKYYPYDHLENFLPKLLKKYGRNYENLLVPNSCGYSFAEWNHINNVKLFPLLSQLGIFSFSHIDINVDKADLGYKYFSHLTNVEMQDIYKNAIEDAEEQELL